MATVTSFETQSATRSDAPRLTVSISRGAVGAALFMLVAFILLAAGAVTGAPHGSGAPVETGAFLLDPGIGSARS